MIDLIQEFGEDFVGLRVKEIQTNPAIDGSWIGITFTAADGRPVNVAIPSHAADLVIAELQKAKAQCDDRLAAPRN